MFSRTLDTASEKTTVGAN